MPRTSEMMDSIGLCEGTKYSMLSSDERVGLIIRSGNSECTILLSDANEARRLANGLVNIADNIMFRVSQTLDAPDKIVCPECNTHSFGGKVDDGYGHKIQCPACNIAQALWQKRNTLTKLA